MRIIKEYTLRKITVILVGLFILFIFNLVPTKSSLKIHGKENYVYLLDDDNYLSKVICYFDTASLEDAVTILRVPKTININDVKNNVLSMSLNTLNARFIIHISPTINNNIIL